MNQARKFTIALALFSLSFMSFTAIRQNVANAQEQTPQKEALGEVERLVAELHKKHEKVIKTCLEHCDSQKHASPDITDGKFDQKVQPEYPAIARAARVSGNVVVLILIDEEGKVMAAQSVSGHPLLQAAAVKAAKASTFHSYLLHSQAVKVTGTITYHFLMD
jgi:TonB family protein